MTAAPAIRRPVPTTQECKQPRKWEPVYSSPFLTGRAEAEITAAIAAIPIPRRGWAIDELAEAIAEYLDEKDRRAKYAALPRRNGYTEEEWGGIMAVLREQYTACCYKCKRRMIPVHDLSETQFYRDEAVRLQLVVDTLLEYIESL